MRFGRNLLHLIDWEILDFSSAITAVSSAFSSTIFPLKPRDF